MEYLLVRLAAGMSLICIFYESQRPFHVLWLLSLKINSKLYYMIYFPPLSIDDIKSTWLYKIITMSVEYLSEIFLDNLVQNNSESKSYTGVHMP